jgi:hypothetical protein
MRFEQRFEKAEEVSHLGKEGSGKGPELVF